MWWSKTRMRFSSALCLRRGGVARLAGMTIVFAVAGLTSGCFQPLYGTGTAAVGANGISPSLRDALAGVDVNQIAAPDGTDDARIAVAVRNSLLFGLTGGGGGSPPTHRLTIRMSSQRQTVIVDVTSQRPDIENYGINASYSLVEIATGKTVVTGSTFSRVSYDIPGQMQRFARIRGLRDAENRAAEVIAGNIRSRLASYFVAGT